MREEEILKMSKIKVSFLFGAGAEQSESNFNICSGDDYKKRTILLKKVNNEVYFGNALEKKFNKIDSTFYKYNKTSSLILDNEEKFFKKILKNYLISKKDSDNVDQLLENTDLINDFSTLFNNSENKGYTNFSELKKILNINVNENLKERCSEIFNIGYGGILDSYFYTIINPAKMGKIKFSKIFNYYWACYFCIVEDILNYLGKKNCNDFFDKYFKNSKLNCEEILSNISEFSKKLLEFQKNDINNNCYYHFIQKQLENNSDYFCKGIITSNYSEFVKKIQSENYSFLNGKINFFEFPELLEIHDSIDGNKIFNDNKLFFPFIFGQSYTKPIVNKFQIEEFYKFVAILKETEILVVLGFSFSYDDNHINSFIHEYLTNDKNKMIYVTNNSDENLNIKLRFERKLDNLIILQVDYGCNKNVVKKIFDKIEEIRKESKS